MTKPTRATSNAASALGRLARGIPKPFTAEERAARTARLAKVRARRWPAKTPTTTPGPHARKPRTS